MADENDGRVAHLLSSLRVQFILFAISIIGMACLMAMIHFSSRQALTGDWFIVQYAPDGNVAKSWELKQKEVISGKGIHFSTENGPVDLVKDYAFLQVMDSKWEEAKKRLLQK